MLQLSTHPAIVPLYRWINTGRHLPGGGGDHPGGDIPLRRPPAGRAGPDGIGGAVRISPRPNAFLAHKLI